ncbi:MAG: N-acetyltransferase [Pseudomonadales bacterium]|nr:N-acetyltransferase [Pseudomonadales bacterium]
MSEEGLNLVVREVTDKHLLDVFIKVPWAIYKDDPHWVPPLIIERREAFSQKHPFFEHARWKAWVVYSGETAVGRISAQIDQLHLEKYQDDCGYFGLIESIPKLEVFQLLFRTAESWLRSQGMVRVIGPFNLNHNQEVGLLVQGFDTPPNIMMVHSRDYYDQSVKDCGYCGAQELLAYEMAIQFETPKVMKRLCERVGADVKVRLLDRKNVERDLEIMRDIFNDAWSENWGFVPYTKNEFKALGKEMMHILPKDFIHIAELDGEAVAFIVVLPNLYEVIKDLNGRLFPFGWLKLLWRIKVKFPGSCRTPLMGVRKKYHDTRLGPTLAFMVIEAMREPALARGIKTAELSWILETTGACVASLRVWVVL